ncbi:nucleoside hydrolase [Cryobacterium sp. TMT2-10]|uniref:Nucleoside hydrolase n=1 Tax=Cryobacterium shii TaxID=1259235 RepID=A0AAQ2C5Y4_9MICO|nr:MULTISPECIES: nucleoside hydrolase [Cryobacterium]TFC46171.1 nucleoside hydrolase [Cryobacterium shii]TFC81631.1 nucleoside hydrolase [Cryobacterium sp. TmT2-59]TFD12508.1 nucleoside hydrolase [Cryobacterium sp. TMT4-10]TFD16710.1 nucleoside hydrolase [Cryobacterium sp. TMT2-23]TFD37674.1 nucleoside hydrolase [Cryobacterium sp. TMT2-10]
MTPHLTPIYLDCGTGPDDALALAFLLATRGIRLAGIGTVAGGVSAAIAAANALNLLETAGRDAIPVAVGGFDPESAGSRRGAAPVHGRNGIGDVLLPRSRRHPVEESATELLIRLAHENPGELEIVTLGPLTNLAEALCLDPELPRLVRRVTVRGGAVFAPGNAGPYAEANIAADPAAAADVFAASWPVTLVPLDATRRHTFDDTHRRALASATGLTQQALAEIVGSCLPRVALHNSAAAAFATGDVEPERAPTLRICVDTGAGPRRGQTRFAKLEDVVEDLVDADAPRGQNPHEARVVLALRGGVAAPLLERMLSLPRADVRVPARVPVPA